VRRVHLDGGQLVIKDRLEGKGERTLESSLQFAPGGEAEAATHGPVQPDRERRWVSERFFERTAAPALVVREERSLPAELGWTIPLR
jgi:hypothetical protein